MLRRRPASFVIAAPIVFLLLTSACEQAADRPVAGRLPGESVDVVFIGPPLAHPENRLLRIGAEREAASADKSIRVTWEAPRDSGPAALHEALDAARHRKPAAICVWSEDPTFAIANPGAPLITVGAIPPHPAAFGTVLFEAGRAAEPLAHALATIERPPITFALAWVGVFELDTQTRVDAALKRTVSLKRLGERRCAAGMEVAGAIAEIADEYPTVELGVVLAAHSLDAAMLASLAPSRPIVINSAHPSFWPWLRDGRALRLSGGSAAQAGAAAMRLALRAVLEGDRPQYPVRIEPRVLAAADLGAFIAELERQTGLSEAELMLPVVAQP